MNEKWFFIGLGLVVISLAGLLSARWPSRERLKPLSSKPQKPTPKINRVWW